jgi:DNA-binding transcriptional regulator GbsR (MarR family)
LTEQEREFVEAMGRHFEADGVPRIGGRMFGFLLLREAPCSLDDLVTELDISKASASTNARLLEEWALIRQTSVPGDRRDYYAAVPDQTRTLEFRLTRVRELGSLFRSGAASAPSPEVTRRLTSMARFNDEAIAALEPLLARWRAGEPE